jgi:hypothetical protein
LQSKRRSDALAGFDQIAEVLPLAVMSQDREGIADEASPINEGHALAGPPSRVWDVVLAHTLFGRLAVFSVIASETSRITEKLESYERDDFIASTTNNQLDFLHPS